jgi:hypothetical protein
MPACLAKLGNAKAYVQKMKDEKPISTTRSALIILSEIFSPFCRKPQVFLS